jgi:hypothetical protein
LYGIHLLSEKVHYRMPITNEVQRESLDASNIETSFCA